MAQSPQKTAKAGASCPELCHAGIGEKKVPLRKVYDETCKDTSLLMAGKYAHNPAYGDAIVSKAASNLKVLRKMMKDKREGKVVRPN